LPISSHSASDQILGSSILTENSIHHNYSELRGHNTHFAGSQSAADRSACEQSLEESGNLPDPDVLAQEFIEDLDAALELFREIAMDSSGERVESE
jgi:hypothetical protein